MYKGGLKIKRRATVLEIDVDEVSKAAQPSSIKMSKLYSLEVKYLLLREVKLGSNLQNLLKLFRFVKFKSVSS